MKKEKIKKYCCTCGSLVDLRKRGTGKFAERYVEFIPNPEYHYYCSEKCYQDRYIRIA